MPVYLTPGVYIEEIPSGARPIEGAATSVAAFVGPAVRGPAGQAELIGKLDDYKSLYGDIASETDEMGLAVQAFYLNGGKNAYICRLSGAGAVAAAVTVNGQGTGGVATTNPVLEISASSVGEWGNDLFVMIEKPNPDATAFDLMVGRRVDGAFEAAETFVGLDMQQGSASYVIDAVNDGSSLISVALGADALIDSAGADYADAVIRGGDTGAAATYFTNGLGGSTSEIFSLNLNGRGNEIITVDLSGAGLAGADHDLDGAALAAALQAAVRAHSPLASFQAVTVTYAARRFSVTSPEDNSSASLGIGGGTLADLMMLSEGSRAVLTGDTLAATGTLFSTGIPANTPNSISITMDGTGPLLVTLDAAVLTLGGTNAADGTAVAAGLQTAIRNAAPDIPSFAGCEVVYTPAPDRQIQITSGSGSARMSSISVAAGTFADFLGISAAATLVAGREVTQGVSPVIPVALPGPGGEGEQLLGGTTVSPSGSDYADFYGNVLRKVRDVTMILLPGQPWTETGPTSALSNTIAFAERQKQMMVLVDPPPGYELDDARAVEQMSPPSSTYTAMYYPRVASPNPLYNVDTNPTAPKTVMIPPSAFAAGIWTKTDSRRGVWKAPAGVETRLVGASALEFEVEDTEQSQLNPLGVNCFRKMPTYGPVVWGSRTLATKAVPEWRYVPVRRTALFIEKSIKDGIQWAVFQPNAHPLWASLRANIGGFMDGLFRAGAFQGETANDAYFVRCNLGDTMTQADIDRGQVIAVVGFAPLKPAEFVIVRIQQKVSQE
ncbi:MAG: phage tail sheath family protein [Roseobacter sp.]